MDLDNPVIRLCAEGTRAEFEGRKEDARELYRQAWAVCKDDYDACVAAHYVARFQDTPEEAMSWNREALVRARKVDDERVQSFYPSLYVNLGRSHELLGNREEAEHFYRLAAELGLEHQPDE
ncbi:tetratricopeptide repeat protein [Sorangium sp. So ce117]|uniref:tetratricopeptide repeat protein n=1 Tax=Sorangium sp. So ce117 TaxID=3133277 RepID=UPI003F615B34